MELKAGVGAPGGDGVVSGESSILERLRSEDSTVGTNFIFKIASLGLNIFAGLTLSVKKFNPDLKFLFEYFSAYRCIS